MENKPVFIPSFGNRPDQLIGRDGVMDMVIEGLQSYPGSAERAILLVGQRGMGKTALLLETADRAASMDYVTARITCGESMLENLIEILQRNGEKYIKESKSPIRGFSAGALGFSIGLTFTEEARRTFGFRVKFEMICGRLAEAGKHILVLVDEVDPSVQQMRELAAVYQELVGDEADISIVMAGLPSSISDILNYKTLTFLNRAQRIPVGLLPVSEVELYYSSAFSRAGIDATPDIVRQAASFTEGFPYLVQLTGYYLSRFSKSGNPVDEAMLRRVEELAADEVDNKVFQAMLNPLSEKDIAFIKTIAYNGGSVKISDLEKSMGISHGTAQTYRKRLIDAGIVFSPRRGELELIMPQLADYLIRIEE